MRSRSSGSVEGLVRGMSANRSTMPDSSLRVFGLEEADCGGRCRSGVPPAHSGQGAVANVMGDWFRAWRALGDLWPRNGSGAVATSCAPCGVGASPRSVALVQAPRHQLPWGAKADLSGPRLTKRLLTTGRCAPFLTSLGSQQTQALGRRGIGFLQREMPGAAASAFIWELVNACVQGRDAD